MKYIQIFAVIILAVTVQAARKTVPYPALFAEYGGHSTKAVFYDEEFLNGSSTTVETEGPCKNLPKRWLKKPLSVDTHGTCALVCTEVDCEGTCVPVYPAHGEQQLSKIDMAKKISSVKSCFK